MKIVIDLGLDAAAHIPSFDSWELHQRIEVAAVRSQQAIERRLQDTISPLSIDQRSAAEQTYKFWRYVEKRLRAHPEAVTVEP